ncbi:MAG: DegT/DnrJ/EryC1/StrS family aminotransferase [Candidatus Sumerlaeia bacterium]
MPDQRIPFADLRACYLELKSGIDAAVARVIDSARFIGGPEVSRFEAALAESFGVPFAVGLNSGTAALTAVLHWLGLKPDDEVICPAHTYVATAEAVVLAGARPVFADVDPNTYQIAPEDVARRISNRTRAVIAVHLYGLAAPMNDLASVATRAGIPVIEDCAQAQGTALDGRPAGTIGLAGCLSFFPSKNLGAFGDAGAVITRQPELARHVRMFANHGRLEKFTHEFPAANERLDALQAAVLAVKLTRLEEWNARKRAAARWYEEELKDLDEIILPRPIPGCDPSWHLYVIRLRDGKTRDAMRSHLEEQGIETGLHYPASVPEQPAFTAFVRESCPAAAAVCATVLSLPMFPHITHEQVGRVGAAIRAFFRGRGH